MPATLIMALTVKGLTMKAAFISMGLKLPASALKAVFASIAGTLLFFAIKPALSRTGILRS